MKEAIRNLFQQAPRDFVSGVFRLFEELGEHGFCACGRAPVRRNVVTENFMCCDVCKTFWPIGTGSYSDWKQQTEADWARTKELLEAYSEIEPVFPFITPLTSLAGLHTWKEIHAQMDAALLWRMIDPKVRQRFIDCVIEHMPEGANR